MQLRLKTLTLASLILAMVTIAALAQEFTVGISWSSFNNERWRFDQAAIVSALQASGVEYIEADARSSPVQQIIDIENLAAAGVDALIIVAAHANALEDVVRRVAEQGIPVISYDRFINDPLAFYLSFDSRETGRLQARVLQRAKPQGQYLFIKGAEGDPNAGMIFSGQLEVLADGLAAGDIINVGETVAQRWSAEEAYAFTAELLDRIGGEVDAILASNDTLASGAIRALDEWGLAGQVAVSGQDGLASALNRVAKGTQTMTVWKDARVLGRRAGELAAFFAHGGNPASIPDAILYQPPNGGWEVNAILLTPRLITKTNLDAPILAGWAAQDVVCLGVEVGQTPICDQ